MLYPILSGLRVMVVEDELFVSMVIEETLLEQGCVVVGPYSTVAAALVAAHRTVIDLAVLDVNVGDTKIYPVAETLAARGVPFLLLSGGNGQDRGDPGWHRFGKPFHPHELTRVLATRVLGGDGRP